MLDVLMSESSFSVPHVAPLTTEEVNIQDILENFSIPRFIANLVINCNARGARSLTKLDASRSHMKSCMQRFVIENPGATLPSFETYTHTNKDLLCHMARLRFQAQGQHTEVELDSIIQEGYLATQKEIKKFTLIQFSGEHNDFRWSSLSHNDRVIFELAAEEFVYRRVNASVALPLYLAEDSWAVRMMLSIQIKNNGSNKAANKVHFFSYSSIHKC